MGWRLREKCGVHVWRFEKHGLTTTSTTLGLFTKAIMIWAWLNLLDEIPHMFFRLICRSLMRKVVFNISQFSHVKMATMSDMKSTAA